MTAAFQQINQRTIGILVTNTDHSTFAQNWPGDGDKFSVLLKSVRPDWIYKIYDCTKGEFPEHKDACHGYVIGGSPASVNDEDLWIANLLDFIRELDAAEKPTIGCCFGHQAMAKALGGTVGRNPGGWGFGVSPTHFAAAEPWMIPSATSLNLYAAHSEQVITLPAAARILGGDEFCPTAAIAVGKHFFSTEYHPEMTKPFFMGLAKAFETYIGTDVSAHSLQLAQSKEAQGLVFAEWMAKFLEQT